ncbi:MAG: DUF1122 family protein [Aquificota bacterium]|nr:DUF1122 family protein [Aquificota bacterium]
MDAGAFLKDLQSRGFECVLRKGRFKGEELLEVFSGGVRLLKVLLFPGRSYYRGWVEVFSVSGRFFGSKLEGVFLDVLGRYTDRVFFEYVEDRVTARELSFGVPPPLSRLGFEIAKRGFTWFRDWYFPEGLREGNPKLQAEKPADRRRKRKHLRDLNEDLSRFLNTSGDSDLKDTVLRRFKILQELWERT